MSLENVELVRQAYDAYNRDGVDGILEYLDTEVEWRRPVDGPGADDFFGHGGVVAWQR